MRVLAIHQNFPGQFKQITPYMLDRGCDVRAVCSHARDLDNRIVTARYGEPKKDQAVLEKPGLIFWSEASQRMTSVYEICKIWRDDGWNPDIVIGHSGWGETLLIGNVWPSVPQVVWPEMWIRPEHAGIGIDGIKNATVIQMAEFEMRNQLTRAAMSYASAWVVPTVHQAMSFPKEFRRKDLLVVHEGINTRFAKPKLEARYRVRGIDVDRSVPTITFINRNLERLRGFHKFMEALPQIMQINKEVRVIVIGDNGSGYAGGEENGRTLKENMISSHGGQLDMNRIHFLGRVPYEVMMEVLQASWVHVYLTYPFILGWSLLEAMSCGCTIVGSQGMPVAEVIENGVNGVLIPFEDTGALSKEVLGLLRDRKKREVLGENARKTALGYDADVLTPKLYSYLERLALNS